MLSRGGYLVFSRDGATFFLGAALGMLPFNLGVLATEAWRFGYRVPLFSRVVEIWLTVLASRIWGIVSCWCMVMALVIMLTAIRNFNRRRD
jgi:uncharacterized membrane protein